jgi:hypothetical protein
MRLQLPQSRGLGRSYDQVCQQPKGTDPSVLAAPSGTTGSAGCSAIANARCCKADSAHLVALLVLFLMLLLVFLLPGRASRGVLSLEVTAATTLQVGEGSG